MSIICTFHSLNFVKADFIIRVVPEIRIHLLFPAEECMWNIFVRSLQHVSVSRRSRNRRLWIRRGNRYLLLSLSLWWQISNNKGKSLRKDLALTRPKSRACLVLLCNTSIYSSTDYKYWTWIDCGTSGSSIYQILLFYFINY